MKIPSTALGFLIVGLLSGGCDPREACDRQYETLPRRQACYQGSQDVYLEVTHEGALPPADSTLARKECEEACDSQYSFIGVSTEDARVLGRVMQQAVDLELICADSCAARIAYERSQRERANRASEGCEQVSVGGITRCY